MNTSVLTGAATLRVAQAGETHQRLTDYTEQLAWPLVVQGDAVWLPAHLGIVGVAMPAGLAGEVNTVVRQLRPAVPVISIPGRPIRWVFLVNAPDEGGQGRFPAPVEILAGPQRIPLPPTVIDAGPVRWVTRPGSSAYLAEIADVLMAVRRVTGLRTP